MDIIAIFCFHSQLHDKWDGHIVLDLKKRENFTQVSIFFFFFLDEK